MAKIAVVGPGALGGTLAAWLANDARHDVTLCARTGFDRLIAETPEGVLNVSPTVLTDPAEATPVDWVFVAVKTYDSVATLPWLENLAGEGTRIAIVQNGVEHVARFNALMPGREIVPVVVDLPAGRKAPGNGVQNAIGWIVVPDGPHGADFVDLFAHAPMDVQAVSNWTSRAWQKLCLNCVGAFSTLTMRSTGPVWNQDVERMVRGLVTECAEVGRAEGADIPDELVEGLIERERNSAEGVGNSLYTDRLNGRPMEIDARNGVIVHLGAKHGIPTPMNELFVTLLNASGSPWATK